MRRNDIHFGKRKNRLFTTLLWITGVACVVTSVLVGSYIYTHINLNKYQVTINQLSSELDDLENMTDQMVEQEEEYKNKLDILNQELAKYEPIVIPESMKGELR